jgi:hypothetical protein
LGKKESKKEIWWRDEMQARNEGISKQQMEMLAKILEVKLAKELKKQNKQIFVDDMNIPCLVRVSQIDWY